MSRTRKPPVEEKEIQGLKYFGLLSSLLERLHGVCDDHRRVLHLDQYMGLFLLHFFNPVLTSLRSIQQASLLPKVQKALGVPRTSLGALSEAGSTFPPEYVAKVVQALMSQIQGIPHDPKLDGLTRTLTAVDGTLFKGVPHMVWALWQSDKSRAVKAHFQLEILSWKPVSATVTAANTSETLVLENHLEPGRIYVMDRGYESFSLFDQIIGLGSSLVARIEDRTVFRPAQERELTDADRAAGVVQDSVGRLGHPRTSHPMTHELRVVEVSVPHRDGGSQILRLATDLMDVPAEIIVLIYHHRWQIELFFRWFKCTLGCKHLLAENPNGIQLQIYAALIATLFLVLLTGKKPTKRTFEMMCLYFQGWATEDDVLNHIASLKTKN